MMQGTLSLQKEVEKLKKQLSESEDKNDKLLVGLETCKGDLAARLRDSIALDTHEDTVRELQERLYSRLEDAKTANSKLQEELFKTQKEIWQMKEEADETEKDLKDMRKINERLDHDLEYEKHVVADLSATNDNLVADLAAKEIQWRSLTRERDDFQFQLAEALLALKEREESEVEARNEFEQFKAETEQAALGLSVHNEGLQVDIDTITKQVDEHERIVAIKDECIAILEREKDALEIELREEKVQRLSNADIPRPPTYRSVSSVSHQSLGEELGGLSDAEFDDEAADGLSDVEEFISEGVDFDLSGVCEIVNIVPCSIAAPKMTLSIRDAVSIEPQHTEPLLLGYSSIRDISSIEPFQPATPMLSMCIAMVADFSPREPGTPELSTLVETVRCLSPIELWPAPLAASSIISTVDYAPVEPTALTVPLILGSQKHSAHVIEHTDFSLRPSTRDVIANEHQRFSVHHTMPKYGHKDLTNPENSDLKNCCSCKCGLSHNDLSRRNSCMISPHNDLVHKKSAPQELFPPKLLNTAGCMSSSLGSESSGTIRHRHGFIDPFGRLPKPSNSNNLENVLSIWPIEEKTLEQPFSSEGSSPCIPLRSCTTTPKKRFSHFIHYFLHALFVLVSLHCWYIRNKLYAWEYANGVGYSEGYGNTHDRYGPYGNGHVLLSMLPLNLLSADSPLPLKAVDFITKTFNAFEGWIGYGPTALY